MANQTIGKIKVVVNNQSLGSLNVNQSGQTESRVRAISYGQPMELHRAIDLSIGDPISGEAIIYNSTTNNFEVAPVTANSVINVIGGTF